MRALDFEGVTSTFTAPPDWDVDTQGICYDLPVCVTEDGYCITLWQPTPEELVQLNAGKPVQINLLGSQPPIIVKVCEQEIAPKPLQYTMHGKAIDN